jgi:hypothetical protein
MAGSIVVTQSKVDVGLSAVVGSFVRPGNRTILKTVIVWTCDASGVVSGNTLTLPSGTIVLVEFIPGAGGVAPTTLYDVTFTSANGINQFDNGAGTSIGADLSATLGAQKVPFMAGAATALVRTWLEGGLYTPVVAAAGNAKQGTINIFQCLDVL